MKGILSIPYENDDFFSKEIVNIELFDEFSNDYIKVFKVKYKDSIYYLSVIRRGKCYSFDFDRDFDIVYPIRSSHPYCVNYILLVIRNAISSKILNDIYESKLKSFECHYPRILEYFTPLTDEYYHNINKQSVLTIDLTFKTKDMIVDHYDPCLCLINDDLRNIFAELYRITDILD